MSTNPEIGQSAGENNPPDSADVLKTFQPTWKSGHLAQPTTHSAAHAPPGGPLQPAATGKQTPAPAANSGANATGQNSNPDFRTTVPVMSAGVEPVPGYMLECR